MPINLSDLISVGLTGNVTIQQKAAQFTKTIVADNTFEGTEKFVAKLRKGSITGNVVASTGIVTIRDTSVVNPLPTYSLAVTPAVVNEGQSLTFKLTTTNVSAGTTIPYTISGISSADIGNVALTGSFTVSATGTADLVLNVTADNLTEGVETVQLTLDNVQPIVSASAVITDSSISPPLAQIYNLSSSASSVSEGGSVTFTLTTTNVTSGTQVPYTITGVSAADIGAPLTGSFVVGPGGRGTIIVPIANDALTEGNETLTITLDSITPTVSQTVTIVDIAPAPSPAPAPPNYRLIASASSVNEGSSVTVTLITTNVTNGTSVPYTISGTNITPADFGGSFLTGNFVVSNGSAQLVLNVAADQTDEPTPEAFTVTLDNIPSTGGNVTTATVAINDTSRTPLVPSYALSASAPSIGEITNTSVVITLTTNNVSAGTLVPYVITGITSDDINGAPLSGSFSVSASGTAQTTLTLTAAADQLTEGVETLTLTLNGVSPTTSVSVRIEDQSRAPVPSYSLNYAIPGYNTSYINSAQKITINGYYRQYLGRNADPGGLKFYHDALQAGTVNLSQIETAIRTSTEAQQWDGRPVAVEDNDVVEITLTTSNVPNNTTIPYTISGINAADISNAPMSGNFTITNNQSKISLTTSPDRITEGIETVTITLGGITPTVSTSFRIFDTSTAPTYTLTATPSGAVNEGSAVTVTLTSTNVNNGTQIPFTISGTGINNLDMTGIGLTWNPASNRHEGVFTIVNNTASITLNITADNTTEGTESFNVTLAAITPTVTTTITINDTSVVQTGTGLLAVPGLSGVVATLPRDATWVAFRIVGAGGSGGGPDIGGTAGLGLGNSTSAGGWSQNLLESGIFPSTVPATFTIPVTIPVTGPHTFRFTTDNFGYFQFDGGQQYNWNQTGSDLTGTIQLQAGVRQLTLNLNNSGGPYSIGLQLFGPDGRLVFNTKQASVAAGGSGGPGSMVEGVVRLPATNGFKVLQGGVGTPGAGGAAYASGYQTVADVGGRGFNISTLTGTVITHGYSGDGGNGGLPGNSGQSGAGGSGGGSSNLFYTADNLLVNIASAAGGGGGGGKARNNNGASHGNNELFTPNPSGSVDGETNTSDGSGGGGGGGGNGVGGRSGQDNGILSSGGSRGINYKNNSLIWDSWNEFNVAVPASTLPGSIIHNINIPQPFGVAIGRGGRGVPVLGNWASTVGTNGTQGAVSVYWTTASTAPSLSSIPAFGDASQYLTFSMPASQDAPQGIWFYANGTANVAGPKTWIAGAGINGVGDWYEINFVSSNPSNGLTKGNFISNIPENTWWIMNGNGNVGYYVNADANSLDVTVSIRRRTTGQVLGTTVYRNIGPGASVDIGFDGGG